MFVSGLGKNLLSVEALQDAGYTTLFRRGHVFIYSENEGPNNMILQGERRGRVYVLQGQHMLSEFGWLLDFDSVSEGDKTEEALSSQFGIQGSRREAASSSICKRVSWNELALMDEQGPDHSSQRVVSQRGVQVQVPRYVAKRL